MSTSGKRIYDGIPEMRRSLHIRKREARGAGVYGEGGIKGSKRGGKD